MSVGAGSVTGVGVGLATADPRRLSMGAVGTGVGAGEGADLAILDQVMFSWKQGASGCDPYVVEYTPINQSPP